MTTDIPSLITALAQGDHDTHDALENIADACDDPRLAGAALARIANKLDPDEIHQVTELEDDIIEVLEAHEPDA